MVYTMEDFLRETHELVLEDALKRRDPDDILKHYDAEDCLKGLDPATIKARPAKQKRDH